MILAIFFALLIRNTDSDKEAAAYIDNDDHFGLANDEEYLHLTKVCSLFYRALQKSSN